jgi:hypothetical protein
MVYVLRQQHGRISYLKIGHSVNVTKRIKGHQTSSAVPLILLGLKNGMKKEETDLHHLLEDFRMNGEWFKDCPETLIALDIIDPAKFMKRKHYPQQRIEAYFYSNRYVAHDFDFLMSVLGYHANFLDNNPIKGYSFRVSDLKMKDIPDRQFLGEPYDGVKKIIYASDYWEKEALFYSTAPCDGYNLTY